ncbi:thiolase domain-containing protein [Rhodophyticola sp. CCM32]|uniref:acetyl-CoA acetyltransferase n=1 Tax=Rhodophyticola sp. CCM32 TaxID=2916397 RepID=UPI00107EE9A2|nr:acetyl-CoA acetyltransferase [Rhodophyticola sp. CCM32]QBX99924.1 thiolase domain-containing protein [Rhodophyticola sp. CCM32]
MTQDPVIAGWAHTKFGKSEAPDVYDLIAEVTPQALDHAGIPASEIDGVFVGCYSNGFSVQAFEAALPAMAIDDLRYAPAARLENACATGSAALYAAADFIAAGRGRTALVVGAEKMTHVSPIEAGQSMLSGSWRAEEAVDANSFADIFGRVAGTYFQANGDHSEELAMIASKNHHNAMNNPFAHMQKPFDIGFCNTPSDKNPVVAGPLRRTDCSLISDGAAAIVLASPDLIDDLPRAISFRARAQSNDILALSRRDATAFEGARRAWRNALGAAEMTLDDLDLVETHDCFTIAELIEYEAMGLAERGQGGRVIRDGVTQMTGRLPVNPSGGLKARGHPLGATGVSQHVMAAMQLTGDAGDMQVPQASTAAVFNMGGVAVANYVSIMERRK